MKICEVCGKPIGKNGVCDDCGLPTQEDFMKALKQVGNNQKYKIKCENCQKTREISRQMKWRINKGLSKNLCLACSNKSPSTNEKRKKSQKGIIANEKNPNWKGDNVGYSGVHLWVRRHKPKPEFCEKCHNRPPYDVANISGLYKRDVNDFEWLCRKCHMENDKRILYNLKQGKEKKIKEYTQEELIKVMEQKINEGFLCFIKWSCESCGERVTCSTPNAVFTEGYKHIEKANKSPCGHISYPDRYGLAIFKVIGNEKLNREFQDKILKECNKDE